MLATTFMHLLFLWSSSGVLGGNAFVYFFFALSVLPHDNALGGHLFLSNNLPSSYKHVFQSKTDLGPRSDSDSFSIPYLIYLLHLAV